MATAYRVIAVALPATACIARGEPATTRMRSQSARRYAQLHVVLSGPCIGSYHNYVRLIGLVLIMISATLSLVVLGVIAVLLRGLG